MRFRSQHCCSRSQPVARKLLVRLTGWKDRLSKSLPGAVRRMSPTKSVVQRPRPLVVVFAPLGRGQCVVIGKLRGSQLPQCSLNCARPGLDAVGLCVGVQEANFLGGETDAKFHGRRVAIKVLPAYYHALGPGKCPYSATAPNDLPAEVTCGFGIHGTCIWLVPGAGLEPARGRAPGDFRTRHDFRHRRLRHLPTAGVWGLDFLFTMPPGAG